LFLSDIAIRSFCIGVQMSTEERHIYNIKSMFNEFIASDAFNGVFTPGDFYKYSANNSHSEIHLGLINRLKVSLKEYCNDSGIQFDSNKAQDQIRAQRFKLLKMAFYAIDQDPNLTVTRHMSTNEQSMFGKYIGNNTAKKLHSKTIELAVIPAWSIKKGKELLSLFASSKIEEFDEFLKEIKISGRLNNIPVKPDTIAGLIYFKETTNPSKKLGHIVVKVGKSEKKIDERCMSPQDISDGVEVRLWGVDDIKGAEDHALAKMNLDPLCEAYVFDGKSHRCRSQEFYEIPSTHLDTVAAYVKSAAKKYQKGISK
jgi:hypothetical protein